MKPMNVMNILNEGKDEEQVCCLCKKKFKGWGNDAWPLADGYCCDQCNMEKVLPARLSQIYGTKVDECDKLKEADAKSIAKRIDSENKYATKKGKYYSGMSFDNVNDEIRKDGGDESLKSEVDKELEKLGWHRQQGATYYKLIDGTGAKEPKYDSGYYVDIEDYEGLDGKTHDEKGNIKLDIYNDKNGEEHLRVSANSLDDIKKYLGDDYEEFYKNDIKQY